MGFFSKKKKTPSDPSASPSTHPSPKLSSTSSHAHLPIPLPVPVTNHAPAEPPLQLRVVLDASGVFEPFTIELSKEDDTVSIRRALGSILGDTSMALFKVAIPLDALAQARTYNERYDLPVNLVTAFPAFNMDDASQLAPSLGPAASAFCDRLKHLRVSDWFPSASTEMINLLVRTTPGPTTSIPFTFLVHTAAAAPSSTLSTSSRLRLTPSPGSPGGKSARPNPAVVDVLPETSISQLKRAVLSAEPGWKENAAEVDLSRVILWRVEMSEEEMIVIEERGGLKCGQMPWPYPPTAPVPTSLADSCLPVSHYFPGHYSNTRMISLSMWIHHSQHQSEVSDCPRFKYPMIFPDPFTSSAYNGNIVSPSPSYSSNLTARPASIRSQATFSTPQLGSSLFSTMPSPISHSNPHDPYHYRSKPRGRPSTAPAVVVTSPTQPTFGSGSPVVPAVPAFGSGSLARRRGGGAPPSRLQSSHLPSPSTKGLGIAMDPCLSPLTLNHTPSAVSPRTATIHIKQEDHPASTISAAHNYPVDPLAQLQLHHQLEDSDESHYHRPSYASTRTDSTSSVRSASSSFDHDAMPTLDFSLLSFDPTSSNPGSRRGSEILLTGSESSHHLHLASSPSQLHQRLRLSISASSGSSACSTRSQLTTPTVEHPDWLAWSPTSVPGSLPMVVHAKSNPSTNATPSTSASSTRPGTMIMLDSNTSSSTGHSSKGDQVTSGQKEKRSENGTGEYSYNHAINGNDLRRGVSVRLW